MPNQDLIEELDNICLSGANSRCPHCYKSYRPMKEGESENWNYCRKGHRTLYLKSAQKEDIQQNLIEDYRSWIPFYKKHHHWIKRIFDDRRKIFLKVLHRDQENIFQIYPDCIDQMIQKAFDIGDNLHRENRAKSKSSS